MTPVPSAQSPECGNGIAVASPANNPGPVAGCEALLSSRDTLAGTGTLDCLNQGADTGDCRNRIALP